MKLIKVFLLLVLLAAAAQLRAQEVIYVQPMGYRDYSFFGKANFGSGKYRLTAPSAFVEIGDSTNSRKGLLLPRGNKDSVLAPTRGLMFYDIPSGSIVVFNGVEWTYLNGGGLEQSEINHLQDSIANKLIDVFEADDKFYKLWGNGTVSLWYDNGLYTDTAQFVGTGAAGNPMLIRVDSATAQPALMMGYNKTTKQFYWYPFSAITDTSNLSARVTTNVTAINNLQSSKLNISDTAGMLGNYRHWTQGYLTTTTGDGRYLRLSGGTLTGTVDFGTGIVHTIGSGQRFFAGSSNITYLYTPTGGFQFTNQANTASIGTLSNTGVLNMTGSVTGANIYASSYSGTNTFNSDVQIGNSGADRSITFGGTNSGLYWGSGTPVTSLYYNVGNLRISSSGGYGLVIDNALTVGGNITRTGMGTGLAKWSSGVLGLATAGTDYQAPISFPSTPLQYHTGYNTFGTLRDSAVASITLNTPNVVFSTPVNFSNSSGAWSGSLSLNSQTANKIFAAPNGSSGTPTFRSLVAADLPALTSGSSILYGNGSGGFSNATIGSGLTFSGGTLSATGSTPSIGGQITSGTAGSVLYVGTNGLFQQSNSKFFYDSTNVKLGLGLNSSLGATLHVKGSGTTTATKSFLVQNSSGATIIDANDAGGVGIGKASSGAALDVPGVTWLDSIRITRGSGGVFRWGSIAIGDSVLKNVTTGTNNIGFGDSALYNATTGNNNVGLGGQALINLTTGASNLAVGHQTLYYLTTGTNNIGVGSIGPASGSGSVSFNTLMGLGQSGIRSSNNVILGYGANAQGTGGSNTVVGAGANGGNSSNTNGQNTMFGAGAGTFLTTGYSLIGIGSNALYNSNTSQTTIGIGTQAGGYTARYSTGAGWTTNADAAQRLDSGVYIGNWARPLDDSAVGEIVIAGYRGLSHGSHSTVIGDWFTSKSSIGGRTAVNGSANSGVFGGTGSAYTQALALSEPAAGAALDVKGLGFLAQNTITQAQRDALSLGVPLKSVLITATGSGNTPTNGSSELTFTGGGGSGARGIVFFNGGALQTVVIYSYGNGYTSAPTVSWSGGGTGTITTTIESKVFHVFCSDCTANGGSTGVMQTWDGTAWRNWW